MSRLRQKSTEISLHLIDTWWKVRPINGFEKYLFPDTQISFKSIQKHKIDPARFIYPRDAMGNMLIPLFNRNTSHIITPFYLPKCDFIKTRSPVWTIKNVHYSKGVIHHVGPMTYDSANDKSQLPCKSGWTQIGRRAFNVKLGLTVPFYDTRKYKQVGDPCSKHAVMIGRRIARKEIKAKKLPNVIKRRSDDNIEYSYNIRDHEAITRRTELVDKVLSFTKSNNVTALDDHIVEVETSTLPSDIELVSQDDHNQHDGITQLKIIPSEEFNT